MTLKEKAALEKDRRHFQYIDLQHRHFAFIAGVIEKMPEHVKPWAAAMFEQACSRCNPNFDAHRFRLACGVTVLEEDQ